MLPEPYQPKHLLRVTRLVAWTIFTFFASVVAFEVTHSLVCGIVVIAFIGYLKWNVHQEPKEPQTSNGTYF